MSLGSKTEVLTRTGGQLPWPEPSYQLADGPSSPPNPLTSSPTRGRSLSNFEMQPPNDLNRAFPVQPTETWHHPQSNILRLASVFFTFFNLGANDAAYGPLIPYLEDYYHISYTTVSLIFLAPFVGFAVAAVISNKFHLLFGYRGISVFAPFCRVVTYTVLCVHPPYGALVAILALGGLGNGLLDASFNSWVSQLQHPNELLGMMHGFYGLGATLAPIIATSMIATHHLEWYNYYYVMVGLGVTELLVATSAFWKNDGVHFREKNASTGGEEAGQTRAALKQKVTWIVSIFLLTYVGTEVSLGGWVVTFMLRVRNAAEFAAGMSATGFWLGITAGRVVLGFVTPYIGERWAIPVYLLASVGLELVFWLVPQFIVSAVAAAWVGFFLGPMFPAAVIAISKLLPRSYHVPAIGFASAVGGGGAAALPFAVGAIAGAKGVQVLQPIILALVVTMLVLWLLLPKIPKHSHVD